MNVDNRLRVEHHDVTGKVKKITKKRYYITDEGNKGDLKDTSIYIFDDNGYLVEGSIDRNNGEYKEEFKSSPDRNIYEGTCYRNGVLESHRLNRYDNQGRLTEITIKGVVLLIKICYTYTERACETDIYTVTREKMCSFLDSDFIVNSKETRKYDRDGNLIEVNTYNKDNSLYSYLVCSFDSEGRIIEQIYQSLNDTYRKTIYKYDKNGNRLVDITYNSNNRVIGRVIRKYEGLSKCVEETDYNEKGKVKFKSSYQYDKQENVIRTVYKEIRENDRTTLFDYTYNYDRMNNWITQVRLTDKNIKEVIEREIQYFEL